MVEQKQTKIMTVSLIKIKSIKTTLKGNICRTCSYMLKRKQKHTSKKVEVFVLGNLKPDVAKAV